MDVVSFDWESTLHLSPTRGIFEDYFKGDGHPIPILFQRFLSFPSNREAYTSLFKYASVETFRHLSFGLVNLTFDRAFLLRVFSNEGQAELQSRISTLGSMIVQQVARDANYNLQGNRTSQVAEIWVKNMHSWVVKRAQSCAQMLNVSLYVY